MAEKLTDRRMELDRLLRLIVKERCGEENVYYQPPANFKMKYPCICYERHKIWNRAADNNVYSQHFYYSVTVIDTKADSDMTLTFSKLPKVSYDRHFVADGLHHDAMTIYY
mgnify:CR=1 FL=1